MGKNNRHRRAAKKRKRTAGRQGHGPSNEQSQAQPPPRSQAQPQPHEPMDLFASAVYAHRIGDDDALDVILERLSSDRPILVARQIQDRLEAQVSRVWDRGWRPAVLDRVVQREFGRSESALLRSVMAAESQSYEVLGREVATDWMDELESVEATRWWEPDRPYLQQLRGPWTGALRAAVRVTAVLTSLPNESLFGPPPSQWRAGMSAAAGSNLPTDLLEKVRALLAKAESTSFDAEADAFTAKAQELMARHRIDRAVLESAGHTDDAPTGRRLLIDDPYADAKALLLQVICEANGGGSVWSKPYGFATVFAFSDELDIIEDLFTSLLVQATAALRREGSKQDQWGRSRTTRFRRSFLVAFANRIGHRLREATDTAVADAEAETGKSLVPVLASRADAAKEAVKEAFPDIRRFSPNANDGEGWHAGTMFGDRADLGVGAPVTERAAS